jgi:hypothetical protein
LKAVHQYLGGKNSSQKRKLEVAQFIHDKIHNASDAENMDESGDNSSDDSNDEDDTSSEESFEE